VTHLAAVAGSHVQEEAVEFCSYCGSLESDRQRVCSQCGLGVRLTTADGALRSPGAAFLVVRSDGRVSAASAAAERMLPSHGDLVGKPVMALLTSRDDEGELARLISLAAAGDPGVSEVDAELVGTTRRRSGVRATVAACGLPRAALVVLDRA
jgi:PAS domain-containing protein